MKAESEPATPDKTILDKERGVTGVIHSVTQNDQEFQLVSFDGTDDQEDIRRVPKARRYLYVIILTSFSMRLTALSSVWSTTNDAIAEHFHASTEVALLGVSMYVLMLALGPLLFAPLSEFYGRRGVYTFAAVGCTSFEFLTAFGTNIESLIIGRALSALFGSAFMSNLSGSGADLFSREEIGVPMTILTLGTFFGPSSGPLIGGFINSSLGFRWVYYVFLIWSGVTSFLVIFVVPETYAPVLLTRKAKRLRAQAGDSLEALQIRSPLEVSDKKFLEVLRISITRPFLLIFLEPMNLLLCFYSGFLLSVVYFFLIGFPIIYTEVYKFRPQFTDICIFGVSVGVVIGGLIYRPIFEPIKARQIRANGGVLKPEFLLPPLCATGIILTGSLFMFAWTIYPSVHFMVPTVAGAIFGLGTAWGFNSIFAYTVETYRVYAASAIAANTFVRAVMSCAFPLFGRQMLEGLTLHWGMSFLAFIALALTPAGFGLYFYGESIRKRSKFAFSD